MAVALGVHVALALIQGASAWLTGGVGVGASALHGIVGILAHGVALGGAWMGTRPPDATHPYGYERYEHVAAMAIGMLLLATVGAIGFSAIARLMRPTPLAATALGVGVMIASAIANASLWRVLRRRARNLASRVVASEATHAGADLLMAVAVIVGLALSRVGIPWLDPVVALGVAGLVAWRGWSLVWTSAEVLTDAAGADVDAIAHIAAGIKGVNGVHAVRCRGELGRLRVDLHIHVDPDLTVAHAHTIARGVAERVTAELGGICEVLVHIGAGERRAPAASAPPAMPPGSREAEGSSRS